MKIGIIGYGVVGIAVETTLIDKYEIIKYDKFKKHDEFSSLSECDFVFITVPTPFTSKKKGFDDSFVIESLQRLEDIGFSNIVIIKSTLIPGSCIKYDGMFKLKIVHNPEFLRESTTPNEDFRNQMFVVIGTSNSEVFNSIKLMYQKVLINECKYYHTSNIEAEMIKSAQNTILASRVALSNVIYDACNKYKIDYDKVRKIAFDDCSLIGPNMVQVPGPDGKRGFGGKCLPKDILAFSRLYKSEIINEIIAYNWSLRDDLDE